MTCALPNPYEQNYSYFDIKVKYEIREQHNTSKLIVDMKFIYPL